MAVKFPKTCKLSNAEQAVLKSLLSDGENPCSDCTWSGDCDGPSIDRDAVNRMFDDPKHKCLLCGNDIVRTYESKLISGVFRFCKESDDEFVFDPLDRLESPNAPASADAIEF